MSLLPNLVLIISFILFGFCNGFKFYGGLINSRVQSATYLTSAVTKILITVEVKNVGDETTDRYVLSLPKSTYDNLALIQVYDNDKNKLQIERESFIDGLSENENDSIFYSVLLPSSLSSDDSVQLKFTLAYIHLLSPLPEQIKKSSKQFFVYRGNQYFYSPYKTEKLGTKYTFASDKFKSYTKPVAEIDGKKITYGPFKDLEAFSFSEVYFHFQFHSSYLTMTEVVRDIEISHWGNVRIEESFLLQHDGAKLKGAYEVQMYDRYEHIMGSMATSDPSAVRKYAANLPAGANNVYYIDRIGNVSTSNFRADKKKSVLEMRPRYPLYGGWKTDFMIGYDVPSAELITIDPITRVHTLNISFGIPFRDPVTDLLITRIALPEGAHDVKVICPYDISMETESKRFTYLDTMIGGGRPLITFTKKNVINLHNEYFQITYVYDTTRIYFKPILIIMGIFTFFSTIMILQRISPSLVDDTLMSSSSSGNGNNARSGRNIAMNISIKNVDYDNVWKKINDAIKYADNDNVKKTLKSAKKKLKKLSSKKDNDDKKQKIIDVINEIQTQLQ